jgi:hypothetical protein
MKKNHWMFGPLFLFAVVACSVDADDDDVRRDTDRTDPTVECTARCSKEKEECVKGCTDEGDCVTACTDKARECDVDCD